MQPVATQTAPQAIKDSLSGSPGGRLQAAVPPATSALGAIAPAAALTSPQTSAQTSAQTTAPLAVLAVAPSGIPVDSLLKLDGQPGAAAGTPGTTSPATPQPLPTLVPGPVQVAQLVNRMGQSEMRVGMNTSAFGNVEVRTVAHAGDVGLMIGSEKGDLRGLLANDMPAIANSLQQQNLRLSSVNFTQGFGFASNSSNSGGGDAQQRSFVPTPAAANFAAAEATPEDSSEFVSIAEFGGASNSLSILA
jgi:hypothetical protein